MRFFYLIFILIISSSSLFAAKNELSLKGGLSLTRATVKAASSSWDKVNAYGFNTHFGYRWDQVEFNLASYIFLGDIGTISYKANNQIISGDGTYRYVSFNPMLKYRFNSFQVRKGWWPYLAIGPSWSLQTIKFSSFSATGNFAKDQKLTYRSYGASLAIGVEEHLKYKEMHPVYIELLYSYQSSARVSIVDISDTKVVKTVFTDSSNEDLKGHFIMLSIGITIF